MSTDQTHDTRTRLLKSARTEFARHGIAGSRVDVIADRAKANKQRIYAYFGSKEGLFSAVLSAAYGELAEQVPVPTTREGLEEYVGQVFDYHSRDNSLVRLLAWEGLHYGTEEIPEEAERKTYYTGKAQALSEVLGIESPEDAGCLLLTLIGIASWPFVVEQQRRLMIGGAGTGDEDHRRIRASLLAFGRAVIDSHASPVAA